MKYYLVGIKGTGMSALANLLKDKGFDVCGSDVKDYYFTEDNLISNDIPIFEFNEKNVTGDCFYVIGSAYNEENVEVNTIIKNNYMYLYYNDFIASMIGQRLIACSGTHGKTTTSHFIVKMLGDECNYIIGDGSGKGFDNELLVLEACEYKEHFLSYKPYLGIITNIEMDNTDYYKNKKQLFNAFCKFAKNSSIILVNGDDNLIKKIKHPHKITYGFKKHNDAIIKILSTTTKGYYIKLEYQKNYYLKVPYLGRHMIYNYVAAYLTSVILGKSVTKDIQLSLPKKRMTKIMYKNAILIDDYAHHPTEIKSLYESLKLTYPNHKLNVLFQPHTYERTIKFKKNFVKELKKFNDVYIMNVFSSRREKECSDKQNIVNAAFKKFKKIENCNFNEIGKKKEVWIFLGAGNASKYMYKIINENE